MKYLSIFAVVAFSVTSCAVTQKPPLYVSASYVDYAKYSKTGFFITESNSVNFDYTPISSVVSYVRSGQKYINSATGERVDDVKSVRRANYNAYRSSDRIKVSKEFIEVTPADALDELYQLAVEKGANGIINLKIRSTKDEVTNDWGVLIILPGYEATGMAIKR